MEFLPTAKREEEERKGRDEGRPLRLLQTSNLSTPRVGEPFLTGYALAASTSAVRGACCRCLGPLLVFQGKLEDTVYLEEPEGGMPTKKRRR